MSTCDKSIEAGLQDLADADNLGRLEAELSALAADECEVIDGYRIAPDGEVLEYVGEPRFTIDSDDKAEWVMNRRLDAVREVESLKAKRAAILANMDREIRHHEGRVKALDYRFAEELTAYVRPRLSGKRRSWACPYGTVAFRRTAARWRFAAAGKDAALEYARKHHPGLVRAKVTEDVPFDSLESFLEGFGITVERLYDEREPEMVRDLARVVEWVPEGETVKIETGVK